MAKKMDQHKRQLIQEHSTNNIQRRTKVVCIISQAYLQKGTMAELLGEHLLKEDQLKEIITAVTSFLTTTKKDI